MHIGGNENWDIFSCQGMSRSHTWYPDALVDVFNVNLIKIFTL